MTYTPYLLLFDFDNTIAQTHIPSPNNINVPTACRMAIEKLFGKRGLTIYNAIGGLNNRAPTELIEAMTTRNGSLFDQPHDRSIPQLAEAFVQAKLDLLLGEIGAHSQDGNRWPAPCVGFLDFWNTIQKLKEQELPITTGIISSGHSAFIEKTFDIWDQYLPDIIITEDDVRPRRFPKELNRRFKPGQLQTALAHREWLRMQGLWSFQGNSWCGEGTIHTARHTRDGVIYFGDDPQKDGELAQGADIPFGLFDEGALFTINNNRVTFGNWTDVASFLIKEQTSLQEGQPWTHILKTSHAQREGVYASHYL